MDANTCLNSRSSFA